MKEPEIQCSLRVYFDNDYDVCEITEKIGIKPHIAIRYSDAGYTQISSIKRSGVWEYYVPKQYKSAWSIQEVLQEFLQPFTADRVKDLCEIVKSNNGKTILGISIFFEHDNLPEMIFDDDVMEIIHNLNASIHINMNEDV
jgi:hypothetical protein